MSRIRKVKGHITEMVGGDYRIYSASDIVESATDKFHETADGGLFFGEPEDPPTPPDNPAKKKSEFIVHFRRPDGYDGEFGFDWMRDDYKDICSNFEELEKDYESMKIYGKPYYVPWLSIFPDDYKQQSEKGKGVRLKLEIERLNTSKDNVGTKIRLSTSSPSLLVSPTEIDSQKSSHEIEIRCTEKIADDKTFIEARDLSSQNLVGKLNVLRNDTMYRFTLFLIRLLDDPDKAENEEEKSQIKRANECYLEHINDDWVSSVANRVNNFGLNQALIQCDVVFKDIKIDSKDWIKKGCLTEDKRIIDSQSFQEAIISLCEDKGVCAFLCGFLAKGNSEGSAWAGVVPTTLNYIICPQYIDYDGSSYAKGILLHEIGHVLGLRHAFGNGNTYKLQMLKTDNIMDYPMEPKNKKNRNPFDRITFSRRQWLKMQEEIVSYHGNKE